MRLRKQLATAEQKEQSAALEVAKCEATKKAATAALAKGAGFRPTPKEADSEAACSGLNLNEELFASFEQWDCDETEKAKLRALKEELEAYRTTIQAKDAEWKSFVDRVKSEQKAVQERMAKKRRGADGAAAGAGDGGGIGTAAAGAGEAAAPPAAAGGGAAAAETTQADDEALKKEAERLSRARFAAQEAAAKEKEAAAQAAKQSGDGVAAS
eukprot:9479019-Pyramimonas_sp.AAC.1